MEGTEKVVIVRRGNGLEGQEEESLYQENSQIRVLTPAQECNMNKSFRQALPDSHEDKWEKHVQTYRILLL